MSTFVLVHGAGTGAWLWSDLVTILLARGHDVVTPTLTGVGERLFEGGPQTDLSRHVADVLDVLPAQAVTLVGFSYGGLVVGGVAQRVPEQVAVLIYLDAFLPADGMTMFDFMPPEVRAALEGVAAESGSGWKMPPVPLERLGDIGTTGAGVDPDVRKRLQQRGPHPVGTYRERMSVVNPAAAKLPCVYISCTEHPPNDPMTIVTERARRHACL